MEARLYGALVACEEGTSAHSFHFNTSPGTTVDKVHPVQFPAAVQRVGCADNKRVFQNKPPTLAWTSPRPGWYPDYSISRKMATSLIKYFWYGHFLGSEKWVCVGGQVEVERGERKGKFIKVN